MTTKTFTKDQYNEWVSYCHATVTESDPIGRSIDRQRARKDNAHSQKTIAISEGRIVDAKFWNSVYDRECYFGD